MHIVQVSAASLKVNVDAAESELKVEGLDAMGRKQTSVLK